MTEKKPSKRQALVMLVEHEDGTLSVIDANEEVHEVQDANQLMVHAKTILGSDTMPSVDSNPAPGPSVQDRVDAEKLEKAFGTLGNRLREVAEAEYGAPLVDAASTVVSAGAKKATGVLRKLSRKGGSSRARRGGSRRHSARRRNS